MSKASPNSKSSFNLNLKLSMSPKRVESPSCVKRFWINDSTPSLGNEKYTASSSYGEFESSMLEFADFRAAPSNISELGTLKETSHEPKNSSFEEEMANAQVQQMFPEFFGSPHFVGKNASRKVEREPKVERGVGVMGPNEFGDKRISFDTTEVFGEPEKSLLEPKWENIAEVGNDISRPSVVTSKNDETPLKKTSLKDRPLKISNGSPKNSAENSLTASEEAYTKSKSSTLNPRKLFSRRSKGNGHKELKEDEEESASNLKRLVSRTKRSPHHTENRGRRRNSSRYNNIVGKDDSTSVEEDSEFYSSVEYRSNSREDADVVGVLATRIHEGLTDIVDIMDTACAFIKDEDTIDFDSDSSESEEDEDSYIQRKIAIRRDRQRRLLHEARRSSQRRRHSESRRTSRSLRSRTRDNEYMNIVSEKQHRRRSRHKSSRPRYASSGRESLNSEVPW